LEQTNSKYKHKLKQLTHENATFHRSQNNQECADQSANIRVTSIGNVAGVLYPRRAAMEREKATY
jgi:hypothetical protein